MAAQDGWSYGAVVMVQSYYMGKGGRCKLARLEKAQIRVSMMDENLNRECLHSLNLRRVRSIAQFGTRMNTENTDFFLRHLPFTIFKENERC
ncbi:MAG: hypothetical protein WHX52_00780 [Anaerolineae bacterium]